MDRKELKKVAVAIAESAQVLIDKIEDKDKRIEKLEEALRRIAESPNHRWTDQKDKHHCGWRRMYESQVQRSKQALLKAAIGEDKS